MLLFVVAAAGASILWASLRACRVRAGVQHFAAQLPPSNQYTWSVDHPIPPGQERWPAAVDGLLAGVAPAVALSSIDLQVVEALDFSSKADLERFDNLQELIRDTHVMDAQAYAGWLARLKGYVGEQVADDVLTSQGYDVLWPEAANNPGWDLLVDGQEYNVKVGQQVSHLLAHFERYPDIPVITSPELADQLPLELQDRVLALDELDHAQLLKRTNDTLEYIDAVDFGPHLPWFTMAFSGFRELGLLLQHQTNVGASVKNLGLDVLGTGGGGWLGGQVGAGLGTAIFPGVGTVVGGTVGAIAGGLFGRSLTNQWKMQAYQQAVQDYAEAAKRVEQEVQQMHLSLVGQVEERVQEAERHLATEIAAATDQHRDRANETKLRFFSNCADFVGELPALLLAAEARLAEQQEQVLAAMPRSHALVRAFWPSEQDIAYRATQLWFEARRKELREAADHLPTKLRTLPEAEQWRRVQEYLVDRRFDLVDMERSVAELSTEYHHTLARCEIERRLARHEVQQACLRHAHELHGFIREQLSTLGAGVNDLAASLKPLQERVKAEARKLGLDS